MTKQGCVSNTNLGAVLEPENADAPDPDTENPDDPEGTEFPDPMSRELNDANFGNTLYKVLTDIGGWDGDDVYIENLPPKIIDLVEGLFYQIEGADKDGREMFREALKKMIQINLVNAGGVDTGDFSEPSQSSWNGTSITGKVSYFGSGGDEQDTASGIYSTNPGVALNLAPGTDESGWNNETTQAWMTKARAGNPVYARITIQGKTADLPIIDVGPNESTDRAIDVTGAGAEKMGFEATDSGFPTDAIGTAEIL